MRTPSSSPLPRAILVVCLAATVLLVLATGIASVAFPYDLSYGEAPVVDQARRAATGQQQYKPELGLPPYVIDNYPPLYPLLVGEIWAATGLPILQVARTVSLLAGCVAGILVGMFAWRLSGRRFAALLAAGLFLGNLFVLLWTPLARVDMLGLALSLGGLWLIYRRWNSWVGLSLATLCLAAAVYTRPTYALAAPLAGTIWLWHCDRRRSALFGAAFLCLIGSLLLLLDALTLGGFHQHTFSLYAAHPFQMGRATKMLGALLSIWPLTVAIAAVGLVDTLLRASKPSDDRADPIRQPFAAYGLAPYTLGALIAALAASKVGSDVNYLLELIAALAIWAALGVAWWPGWQRLRRHHATLLVTGQVIIMLLLGWKVAWQQVAHRWAYVGELDRVFQRVQAAVRHGPVLADDYLGMVVRAGQPIYFQPFDYRQLHAAGKWDPSALIGEIEAGRFPLILLNTRGTRIFDERWIPEVVEAIDARYCPVETAGALVVYEPSTAPCPAP